MREGNTFNWVSAYKLPNAINQINLVKYNNHELAIQVQFIIVRVEPYAVITESVLTKTSDLQSRGSIVTIALHYVSVAKESMCRSPTHPQRIVACFICFAGR